MIAIGNAANNFYLGKENKELTHLEFLCWEESEITDLMKEFKIIDSKTLFENAVSKTYKLNTKLLTIHNVTKMPFFQTIQRSLVSTPTTRRIASPMLAYSWCKVKSTFISNNLDAWEQNVLACSALYQKYFTDPSKNMSFRLATWRNSLIFFAAMGFGAKYEHYDFKPFVNYTETSLLELYKHSDTGSIYSNTLLAVSGGGFQLSKTLFDRLPFDKKIGLVMERIYTDCTNEYILDEILYKENSGVSTVALFKTSIMNRCSSGLFPWFTEFIIHNYPTIMKEFDPHFVDELYDALKYKLLD